MPFEDLLSLNEATAVAATRHLLAELVLAEDAVLAAQRRAAGIRKMIEAVVEMFPHCEDELPEEFDGVEQPRPRGAEAVRRCLLDDVGGYYSVADLVQTLDERGWLPRSTNPANAVRTAAERLVEQGHIKKQRRASDDTVVYGIPDPGSLFEEDQPYDAEEPF